MLRNDGVAISLMTEKDKPGPSTGRKRPSQAFVLGELIGEQAVVKKSGDKGLQGVRGLIVDESFGTFVLDTASGRKRIPKKGSEFFFPAHGGSVKGDVLLCRPQDRTKKLFREFSSGS